MSYETDALLSMLTRDGGQTVIEALEADPKTLPMLVLALRDSIEHSTRATDATLGSIVCIAVANYLRECPAFADAVQAVELDARDANTETMR